MEISGYTGSADTGLGMAVIRMLIWGMTVIRMLV